MYTSYCFILADGHVSSRLRARIAVLHRTRVTSFFFFFPVLSLLLIVGIHLNRRGRWRKKGAGASSAHRSEVLAAPARCVTHAKRKNAWDEIGRRKKKKGEHEKE